MKAEHGEPGRRRHERPLDTANVAGRRAAERLALRTRGKAPHGEAAEKALVDAHRERSLRSRLGTARDAPERG